MLRWEKGAPKVQKFIHAPTLVAAHNIGFDAPFVGGELLLVGMSLPVLETFCTMEKRPLCLLLREVPEAARALLRARRDLRPRSSARPRL